MADSEATLGGRQPLLDPASLEGDQKKLYELLDSTLISWANSNGFLIDHTTFGLMGPPAHTTTRKMSIHCVILQIGERVILLDTGFGTREMLEPNRLLGDDALFRLGILIDVRFTASERLKARGIRPEQVTDIVLTHLDNDHAGGVHDFPNATVHVSHEELNSFDSTRPRGPYKPCQISHSTKFKMRLLVRKL